MKRLIGLIPKNHNLVNGLSCRLQLKKRGTGLRDEYSETCDNMNSDRVFTLVSSWLWKAARVVARILKKGHLSWKMYVLVKIAKKRIQADKHKIDL